MIWNVIVRNMNTDSIETFNVFDHYGVIKDIASMVRKRMNRAAFAEELRRSLMYHFWSKYEWEVLVSPWGSNPKDIHKKIDVYWQIMNNWDIFLEYTWKNRKVLTERMK